MAAFGRAAEAADSAPLRDRRAQLLWPVEDAAVVSSTPWRPDAVGPAAAGMRAVGEVSFRAGRVVGSTLCGWPRTRTSVTPDWRARIGSNGCRPRSSPRGLGARGMLTVT